MAKKRTDITEQTRAHLEEAFWGLYERMPIEKVTVGAVCEAAGYNRGTFYLHYHDIYELLGSIEARFLDGMTACVEQCMRRLARDRSKLACLAALAEVIVYYERNRRQIVVLLGEKGDPAFLLQLKSRLKPLWREYVVDEDAGYSEQEFDLLLEYTLTGTLFMVSRWLQDPGDISAAQIGHLVYDMAIRDVSRRTAE